MDWLTTPEPAMLLNLNITEKEESQTLRASLKSFPPPMKSHPTLTLQRVKAESDQASRSEINRTFCSYGNIYTYTIQRIVIRQAPVTTGHLKCGQFDEGTENFSFILIHLNSHSWLMPTILESKILDLTTGLKEIKGIHAHIKDKSRMLREKGRL